jgi:predicted signal transduction protein with EAL and GGDEF domain
MARPRGGSARGPARDGEPTGEYAAAAAAPTDRPLVAPAGVQAANDCGTGYSSLAYLRQFPVDSLKIDRSFITGLELSSETHALTHTLIQLGKALGLETLAEGVEHDSQVRQLQREGCDLDQGFLFARPLAPEAVERFLEDSSDPDGEPAPAPAHPTAGR